MSIVTHTPRAQRGFTHVAQRGFTLIEILVTVVLISVGLLGVAALQLTTLRGNQEAYVRSQASVLASDMLDRIRANPFAFRQQAYDADFNATGNQQTRAGLDLREWQDTIDQILPGDAEDAAGRVVRIEDPATRRQVVEITIRWRERPEGNDAPTVDPEAGMRTFRTRSEI